MFPKVFYADILYEVYWLQREVHMSFKDKDFQT
jgi:hypothetical protein